jgi:uncharacterized membrane protein (DUF485 family)
VDPTAQQPGPGGEVAPETAPETPETGHWSPFTSRAARWSWGLMALFTIIYFVVAVLTSKEFAEVAATMVFGLPLGFILGIGLIVAGLIITRVYLAKVEA